MKSLGYTTIFIGLAFLFNHCAGLHKTADDNELRQLIGYMTGTFDSGAQAKRDSDYFDISLHMTPVRLSKNNDKDGYWLYIEQAVTAKMDKPYRQRLYLVQRVDKNTFKSRVFLLKKEKDFVGAWKDIKRFDTLSEADYEEKEGCAVVLTQQKDHTFTGGTVGNGCESNLRGASYASSKVTITPKGLFSWDQGFDKDGKQVWGATKGGYDFIKHK